MPPTTFGMFFVENFSLPGSSRSGENARKNSRPQESPPAERRGRSSSRVVPGYVVDSRTTSWPGRSWRAIVSAVERTNERSGSRCRPSGVGTQTRTASHADSSAKSDVARIRPRRNAAATRSGPMCRM
jgi:hypothetical protein